MPSASNKQMVGRVGDEGLFLPVLRRERAGIVGEEVAVAGAEHDRGLVAVIGHIGLIRERPAISEPSAGRTQVAVIEAGGALAEVAAAGRRGQRAVHHACRRDVGGLVGHAGGRPWPLEGRDRRHRSQPAGIVDECRVGADDQARAVRKRFGVGDDELARGHGHVGDVAYVGDYQPAGARFDEIAAADDVDGGRGVGAGIHGKDTGSQGKGIAGVARERGLALGLHEILTIRAVRRVAHVRATTKGASLNGLARGQLTIAQRGYHVLMVVAG